MTDTRALFKPGAVEARQLSRAYATTLYRTTPTAKVKWGKASGAVACDECFARQHEADGRLTEGGGVRAPARAKRIVQTGNDSPRVLFLCGEHEQLWRDRDDVDKVPTR